MDQERLAETHEPWLSLTAEAVKMVKRTLAIKGVDNWGLRMTVSGGGCKGFQYSLNLERAARDDDHVVVQDGITTYLDPTSARHLRGTRLDYVTNRHGTGFHFSGSTWNARLAAAHPSCCAAASRTTPGPRAVCCAPSDR